MHSALICAVDGEHHGQRQQLVARLRNVQRVAVAPRPPLLLDGECAALSVPCSELVGKELALDMPVRAFHGVFLHEKGEMLDDLRTFLPADGHGKAGAERQHLLMDAGRLPAGEVIDAQYLSPGEQLLLYDCLLYTSIRDEKGKLIGGVMGGTDVEVLDGFTTGKGRVHITVFDTDIEEAAKAGSKMTLTFAFKDVKGNEARASYTCLLYTSRCV